MIDILLKSLKDVFDKEILFASLIPIIVAALFWGIVFFIFHTQINSFFAYIADHIPFISDSNWIKNIIETIGGIFIYYELLIITSVMIVGIIADKIVDKINKKYYNLEKKGFGTLFGSLSISLKQNIIFILLFLVLIPAMFIPMLNILANLILWTILIKEPMYYDSIAMYATKDEYKQLQKNNKLKIIIIAFLSASLFLVPLFGVFVYVLQLLIFTHFNLSKLQEIR